MLSIFLKKRQNYPVFFFSLRRTPSFQNTWLQDGSFFTAEWIGPSSWRSKLVGFVLYWRSLVSLWLVAWLIDWLDNWSATLDEMKKQQGTFSPQSESLALKPVLNGAETRKSLRKSRWTRTREREPRWGHTVRFGRAWLFDSSINQSMNRNVMMSCGGFIFPYCGFSAYRIALIYTYIRNHISCF